MYACKFIFFIVCAFPYILAFTSDTIEIRLVINGNLVQSMMMPNLKLITSKVIMLNLLVMNVLKLN